MNLNHLQTFVAVAESMSFSRAAERLHISQPALSKQIRSLEEDLEAKLFVRNRRSVALSAVGKAILHDAERLLAQAEEIKQKVTKASQGTSGTLRMGFVASATSLLVPRLTIIFRRAFPDVSLELKNLPTMPQIEALRQRTLDVGLVRLPLREDGIDVLPLSSEPFAIVLSKQHRLKVLKKITVKDLQHEDFVSYGERFAPAFFQHWTGLCRKAGFTPRIVQEVSEMETALALVAVGVGVAIIPEGIAKRHARSLIVMSLKAERIRSEIGLAFPKVNPTALARQLLVTAKRSGILEQS